MPPRGPFPRTFEIKHTDHATQRRAQRAISTAEIEDTIKTGAERPQPGTGGHGGRFVKFSKGSVVVIAEICGKVCHVITTYHDA